MVSVGRVTRQTFCFYSVDKIHIVLVFSLVLCPGILCHV